MIVIFSYQREQLLKSLLNELKGENILVLDDGSTYPIRFKVPYYRYEHLGKERFWQLWHEALKMCDESKDDWFMFIQDDVSDVDLQAIQSVTEGLDYFAYNFMNRGPDRGWTKVPMYPVLLNNVNCQTVRYVDCNFVTNRKTMDKIGWYMMPVPMSRFINPYISSGVGQQLSRRFAQNDVLMYKPIKSMARHGDHESLMHPFERKINPLISI